MGLLIGYFSAVAAKRELVNAVTNLASLDYRVNDLLLSKDAWDKYEDIRNAYLTAKEFEVLSVVLFSFINSYMLLMHKTHSAHIDRPMKA